MEGIRILEVAEHTFVPAASAILADWGAEVIKIEHVERGDAMRGLGSVGLAGIGGTGVHVLLEHSNRGKQSIGLDLAQPEGLDILYKLAARCDVFLTNKMQGVRERLKIDVDDIRAANPSIIYVRGTGYGNNGPDADQGGYDFLGFWSRSGVGDTCTPSDLDGFISQPGAAFGDSIGAMTIAGGIAAALLHRERTGEPHVVDVSLLGTGMWSLGATIALSLQHGVPMKPASPARGGAAPGNPLIGPYRTEDGRWIALSMLQGFFYWPEFVTRLGHEELIADPRFDSHEHLQENTPAAQAIVAEELGSRTLRGMARALRGHPRAVGTRAEHDRARRGPAGTRERLPADRHDLRRRGVHARRHPGAVRQRRVTDHARTRLQRARRGDPPARARPRLGRHHRPQDQGHRRLTLPVQQARPDTWLPRSSNRRVTAVAS